MGDGTGNPRVALMAAIMMRRNSGAVPLFSYVLDARPFAEGNASVEKNTPA